jgi:hypothetical protein
MASTSVPAHLTDEEAATLFCGCRYRVNALVREARIKAGDMVVRWHRRVSCCPGSPAARGA